MSEELGDARRPCIHAAENGGKVMKLVCDGFVVIPAGTGHWFTRIDDHIDYIMVWIDPDKVTPLKSKAQSAEYLSKPAKRGE
jgi:cupin superfamily acireductone dioxygenase involved in methionine salvage